MYCSLHDNLVEVVDATRKVCTNSGIALATAEILREVTLAEVKVDCNHALSGVCAGEGEIDCHIRLALVRQSRSRLNDNSLITLALHHILDVTANDTHSLGDAVLTGFGDDNLLILLLLALAWKLTHDRNIGEILHIFAVVHLGVE